jgi:hypothetical protein
MHQPFVNAVALKDLLACVRARYAMIIVLLDIKVGAINQGWEGGRLDCFAIKIT